MYYYLVWYIRLNMPNLKGTHEEIVCNKIVLMGSVQIIASYKSPLDIEARKNEFPHWRKFRLPFDPIQLNSLDRAS